MCNLYAGVKYLRVTPLVQPNRNFTLTRKNFPTGVATHPEGWRSCSRGTGVDGGASGYLEGSALTTVEGGENTWNVVATVEYFSFEGVDGGDMVVVVEEVEVINGKLLAGSQ